jgi:hypothetical protein
MRALSPVELLAVWERGNAALAAERAWLLLAAAHPDIDPDRLARLSVGRRDAQLVALRERLFGSPMHAVSACPACGERVTLSFDASAIGIDVVPDPGADVAPAAAETVTVAGHEITFRLPDGDDLEAIAGAADVPAARAALLARCVVSVRRDGADVALEEAPAAAVEAVAERMAELDPAADIRLGLTCPSCTHTWSAALDIVGFLWREIDAWAARTLGDVHALASAYGWSEAEILRLGPARRRTYLELIAG